MAASKSRVALRGYERMASMTPAISRKVAHVLLVHGRDEDSDAVDELLRVLPAAVARTFNKHPRMRALQLRGEFAAEIQPHVTVPDVDAKQLLVVLDQDAGGEWGEYVERECEVPFDRFQQFPFFLRVWRGSGATEARFMLFSDHYMSDGLSGVIVLNDILQEAAELSRSGENAVAPAEVTLHPSVYELWLNPLRITRAVGEHLVWLLGRWFFKRDTESFTPLLPPRSDQKHMTVPVTIYNRTRAMFADGSSEKAPRILAKCKKERASYGAAVMAATAIAYYHTAVIHSAKVDPEHFRMAMSIDVNLRTRISTPVDEELVGYCVGGTSIAMLATSDGVDLTRSKFWDVARSIRTELVAATTNDFKMAMSPMFMDQSLHAEAGPDVLGFDVPFAITSDTGISSLGRYPYAKSFSLGKSASTLDIESLHFYNPCPCWHPGVVCTSAPWTNSATDSRTSTRMLLLRPCSVLLWHWLNVWLTLETKRPCLT
ncbi:unnamed protein product [Phytophthora lilii]|uniref:Unnamed protein product n=1 Tax=Phytophthora lilii TaxID=2077276 RepID=A0A9W7CRF4_9STRA|nr:unnamed protein product [Phytophthora lilii]